MASPALGTLVILLVAIFRLLDVADQSVGMDMFAMDGLAGQLAIFQQRLLYSSLTLCSL